MVMFSCSYTTDIYNYLLILYVLSNGVFSRQITEYYFQQNVWFVLYLAPPCDFMTSNPGVVNKNNSPYTENI